MPVPEGYCSICYHKNIAEINESLFTQTKQAITAQYGFTIPTLDKHIRDCLKTNYLALLHQKKIENFQDADSRYQLLVKRGEEAIESAAESLRVNGEINLNPRSWEVNVVYEHPFLRDDNGKPIVLTDTLENVLNLLSDNNIKVKKSILKMEDIRKTYREERKNQAELIDKYFRIFGAYKLDESQQKTHDQLESIRATIEHAALKLKTNYHTELAKFIEIYGKKLRPELLKILQSEELNLRLHPTSPPMPQKRLLKSGALSAPVDQVKEDDNKGKDFEKKSSEE